MNKRLLVILFVLALPVLAFPVLSFAEPEMTVVPYVDSGPQSKSGSDASSRSWLANDLFHELAHACNFPSGTCGPDNLVTNPFGARILLFVPTTQTYTVYWIFTDTEGNALSISAFNFFLTGNTTQNLFLNGVSLPNSGSVATRGLYKFISLIVGNNGIVAFSDYYRFRVLP
jgi:hypothetical protein